MKILKVLNERLEQVFLVTLLILATAIVFAQIVTRYCLHIALPWSEEIARYMFLWLTWVGAAYATKERKHVTIDIVFQMLPKAGQRICTVISTIIWIIFLIVMIRISVKLTMSVASGGMIGIGSGIPMWLVYASVPVGMGLMLFRLLQNCWHDWKAAGKEEEHAA